MFQSSTSHRLPAEASLSTIQREFLTNLYRLEALRFLAQAAMTDGIDREDDLAIGVAVLFQDVLDVFHEIKNHLERASH